MLFQRKQNQIKRLKASQVKSPDSNLQGLLAAQSAKQYSKMIKNLMGSKQTDYLADPLAELRDSSESERSKPFLFNDLMRSNQTPLPSNARLMDQQLLEPLSNRTIDYEQTRKGLGSLTLKYPRKSQPAQSPITPTADPTIESTANKHGTITPLEMSSYSPVKASLNAKAHLQTMQIRAQSQAAQSNRRTQESERTSECKVFLNTSQMEQFTSKLTGNSTSVQPTNRNQPKIPMLKTFGGHLPKSQFPNIQRDLQQKPSVFEQRRSTAPLSKFLNSRSCKKSKLKSIAQTQHAFLKKNSVITGKSSFKHDNEAQILNQEFSFKEIDLSIKLSEQRPKEPMTPFDNDWVKKHFKKGVDYNSSLKSRLQQKKPSIAGLAGPKEVNEGGSSVTSQITLEHSKINWQIEDMSMFARSSPLMSARITTQPVPAGSPARLIRKVLPDDSPRDQKSEKKQTKDDKIKLARKTIEHLNKSKESILEIQNSVEEESSDEPEPFNLMNVQLYKERGDEYKILSNRMRILKMKHKKYPNMRNYDGQSSQNYSNAFDPMRQKIRLMPQTRVRHLGSGKNPDFYFLKAAKQSLNNELTNAIESLNKGLAINPSHLLCKFNHGVLMYKLGLLSQARSDFQMISALYKKEFAGHYNFGMTLFQLGLYKEALDALDLIICQSKSALSLLQQMLLEKSGKKDIDDEELEEPAKKDACQPGKKQRFFDFELLHDTYMLKAQCYYRSNDPLECVKNLNLANKFQDWRSLQESGQKNLLTTAKLNLLFRNLVQKEMRLDIREAKETFMSLQSKSVPKELHKARPYFNEVLSKKGKTDVKADSLEDLSIPASEIERNERNDQREIIISISERIIEEDSLMTESSVSQFEVQSAGGHLEQQSSSNLKEIHPKKRNTTVSKQRSSIKDSKVEQKLKDIQSASSKRLPSNDSPKPTGSPRKSVTHDLHLKPQKQQSASRKVSIQNPALLCVQKRNTVDDYRRGSTMLIKKLKTSLIKEQQIKLKSQEKKTETLLKKITDEFYDKLKEEQIKVIDEGYFDLRFYKVYQYLLNPIDGATAGQMKDRIQEDRSLNFNERRTMMNKIRINEHYEKVDKQDMLNLTEQDKTADSEGKESQILDFYEIFSKCMGKTQERIRNRVIDGSIFSENGVVEINMDQEYLETLMDTLCHKVDSISHEMIKEINEQNQKIVEYTLMDEVKLVNWQNQQKKEGHGKKFIKQLKEVLHSKTTFQDQIENVLSDYLEDRKKMREEEKNEEKNKSKGIIMNAQDRLTLKQMTLIAAEMQKKQGRARNIKVMAQLLNKLKYFENYDKDKRKLILEITDVMCVPSNTVIYNKGDLEDNMYVIVKGKVAVQIIKEELGNLPLVISLLGDGDHFGQLTYQEGKTEERQCRKTTCITVEDSLLFVMNRQVVDQIEQTIEQDSGGSQPGQLCPQELKDRAISNKMKYLQKHVPQFKEVDHKDFLKAMAKNLKVQKYSFGQVIVEEGATPKGLYILKEGQCKVILKNQGERRLFDNRNLHSSSQAQQAKKGRHEDSVFQDFNPDYSVLNQINFMDKHYQNQKIMVDKNKQEIKNKILFNDQNLFKQLTPGCSFGGRTLIPFEQYQLLKQQIFGMQAVQRNYPSKMSAQQIKQLNEQEPLEKALMKSLQTIVSDSAQCEVWFLDKALFIQTMMDFSFTMPEVEQRKVYENILVSTDEDRYMGYQEPEIQYIKQQFQMWDRYKNEQIENFFERRAYVKYLTGQ